MRPKPKSTSPAQQKKTPNPASASIPPSIPMKINGRFSPNPGTLQKSRTASPMRRLPLSSTETIPSTARRPALPSRRTKPSQSEPWHSQPGCGRPAPANRRRPNRRIALPLCEHQNPNPASASIPPSISMKINDRFSPNTGTLQKSRTASPMRRLPLSSTETIPSTARRPTLPTCRTQPSQSEPWHSQPGCGRPAPANRRRPNRRIALPLCEHQNPNPASASIPPSIPMKINDRFSPNTGTLQKSRTASPMRRLPLPSTGMIPSTRQTRMLASHRDAPPNQKNRAPQLPKTGSARQTLPLLHFDFNESKPHFPRFPHLVSTK